MSKHGEDENSIDALECEIVSQVINNYFYKLYLVVFQLIHYEIHKYFPLKLSGPTRKGIGRIVYTTL